LLQRPTKKYFNNLFYGFFSFQVVHMSSSKRNLRTYIIFKMGKSLAQEQKQEGFTLIELLVSIIIIGVLSAIALPSFLNTVSKARGSEAKSNLGAINRAQQVYRFEKQVFAPDLSALASQGMNVNGKFYMYSVTGGNDTATVLADPGSDDLKVYAAGVVKDTNQTVVQIICESIQPKGSPSNNTAVTNLVVGPPANANCSAGNIIR
jgi:type IV pilus assembly protein PilA